MEYNILLKTKISNKLTTDSKFWVIQMDSMYVTLHNIQVKIFIKSTGELSLL
jgi:hypothetical protein